MVYGVYVYGRNEIANNPQQAKNIDVWSVVA